MSRDNSFFLISSMGYVRVIRYCSGEMHRVSAQVRKDGLRSVVEEEVRDVEFSVVGDRLVERFLGERYGLGLALDDHEGEKPTPIPSLKGREVGIDHGIGTEEPTPIPSLKGRETESHLDGDEGGGKAVPLHETVEQLLPHPLFGRETHPPAAEVAENLLFVVVYACAHKRYMVK
jgi:hypothetical protein